VNAVAQGDTIETIQIEWDVDSLFAKVQDFVDTLNKTLDK
jgi:flagellar capping protein FliD